MTRDAYRHLAQTSDRYERLESQRGVRNQIRDAILDRELRFAKAYHDVD